MSNQLPNLTVDEIRDTGILQEINRRLLHPRGLAMFVDLDPEAKATVGIYVADDPEGWTFDWEDRTEEAHTKAERFDNLLKSDRETALGFVVQPLPEAPA